jgi:hypothetical protein
MPDLEPITREEMLLDGQDLEPITRKEMFIKRIYDKTQVVPEPITREEMFLKKAGDETTDVTIEQLSVSENGTYSEEGKAYSPVIVNVPAPPIPDNAYLLNEVEGLPSDIATFTDGSNLPMPKLQVGIESIQDLHGYDSPWVGGSGVNLCEPTLQDNASSIVYNNVTLTSDGYKYHLYGTASASGGRLNLRSKNFTLKAGTYSVGRYLLESADTSTNCHVQTPNGTIIASTTSGNQTFILESDTELYVGINIYARSYNSDIGIMIVKGETLPAKYSPYSNICPISGWDEVNITVADDLENPTVSNVYTIDLDGTRYGGKVDLVSGVMTVTHMTSIYDGSKDEGWALDSNLNRFFIINDEVKIGSGRVPVISNIGKYSETGSDVGTIFAFHASGHMLIYYYPPSNITSVSDYKTWLSTNNLQVRYELATPLTIQLPPTVVKSLRGKNNVFADSGNILDLSYLAKEE